MYLPALIRRLFGLPPPIASDKEPLEIKSESCRFRAMIYRRAGGVFRVDLEEAKEYFGADGKLIGYVWTVVPESMSLVDSLERAKEFAMEKLRGSAANDPWSMTGPPNS